MLLESQGLVSSLREILKLDEIEKSKDLIKRGRHTWDEWKALATSQERLYETVSIALVGKYTNLHDSYLSVIKSLEHAAMHCRRKLNLIWVDASDLEPACREKDPASFHKAWHQICTADGILVPGGFGQRGTEGMIAAATWARTNRTPYLGICLGMQLAVIEWARNVVGIKDATSAEFLTPQPTSAADPSNHNGSPVIEYMPEIDRVNLGGTMRLGLRPTLFQAGSKWSRLRQLYGTDAESVMERHRHRYEVAPAFLERLEAARSAKDGDTLTFVGKDEHGKRMEIIELRNHPWYVGVQFHPEYLSRVLAPSKPYLGFVAAAAKCFDETLREVQANAARLTPARASGVLSPGVLSPVLAPQQADARLGNAESLGERGFMDERPWKANGVLPNGTS